VVAEKVFQASMAARRRGRLGGEGRGLPDDEGGLLFESRGAEELGQSRPGALVRSRGMPGVVGFVDVFAVGERDVGFGDGSLEIEDAGGTASGSARPARRNIAAMWVLYFSRTSFMWGESER